MKVSIPQVQAPRRLVGFSRIRLCPAISLTPRPFSARSIGLTLGILVVLGLGLRAYCYLDNPPVWHDEAAQIYNVLHKDFTELLGPLYYSEACPPLFHVLEKAVVLVLGDSPYALRLPSVLASCASLVALIGLARALLPEPGLLSFTLLLSCSSSLLWHACEAKPYSVDVLVATTLLVLLARCNQGTTVSRVLGWLAVFSPALVFLSFPAIFVLGGVALTLLPMACRARCNRWLYAAFVVMLASSFLVLYTTAIQAQKDERILACWAEEFPPWNEPWLVPLVTLRRLSEVFRYAAEPVGNILVPLGVVGGVWLWRAGQGRLLGVLVWPIVLNMLAWLMCSYPLDASRVVVYASPAALLLIGAGTAPTLEWLRRRAKTAPLVLAVLFMVPVGQTALIAINPWKRLDSRTPFDFVLEQRRPDEPVVGVRWEQQYYGRGLGPLYRSLVTGPAEPPSLPSAAALGPAGLPTGEAVRTLWLLSSHDPAEQTAHMAQLKPEWPWRVVERYAFRDVTVLHVSRE